MAQRAIIRPNPRPIIRPNPREIAAGGPAPGISDPLDTIIATCVADLDATILASTDGVSQTWSNYVSNSAYNFFRGATGSIDTDDPSFVGTPGDSAAHWLHNGSTFFQIAGGNTALLADNSKTTGGSLVTYGWAFRTPAVTMTPNSRPMGNNDGIGWSFFFRNAGTRFEYAQAANQSIFLADPAIVANTEYILLLSINPNTGTSTYWLNSTTGIVTAITLSANTDEPTSTFTLGANMGDNPIPNGYLTRGFYIFSEFFNDTKAGLVFTHLDTRHELSRS